MEDSPVYVSSSPAVGVGDMYLLGQVIEQAKKQLVCIDPSNLDIESRVHYEVAHDLLTMCIGQMMMWEAQ
jgi:hypothetical protein